MSDGPSPHASEDAAEPQTPMWLPALGAALLVALGIAWAVMSGNRTPPEPPAASSGAAAVPAASNVPARADRK